MSDFTGYPFRSGNKRMTEFQTVVLILVGAGKKEANKRLENALYFGYGPQYHDRLMEEALSSRG